MVNGGMKQFLQRWAINTLAVLAAVYIVSGKIHYGKPLDLLVASLLLGILNAFLRPRLFTLVINGLLLYSVSLLLRPHFYVDDFWGAFWGALVISIVAMLLNMLTVTSRSRIRFEHRRRPPGSGGTGTVIDI